jgi:hypothetical protein
MLCFWSCGAAPQTRNRAFLSGAAALGQRCTVGVMRRRPLTTPQLLNGAACPVSTSCVLPPAIARRGVKASGVRGARPAA